MLSIGGEGRSGCTSADDGSVTRLEGLAAVQANSPSSRSYAQLDVAFRWAGISRSVVELNLFSSLKCVSGVNTD